MLQRILDLTRCDDSQLLVIAMASDAIATMAMNAVALLRQLGGVVLLLLLVGVMFTVWWFICRVGYSGLGLFPSDPEGSQDLVPNPDQERKEGD